LKHLPRVSPATDSTPIEVTSNPDILKIMQQLLETIKIIDGIPQFLAFHNQRFNDARQFLFHATDIIDLHEIIQPSTMTGIERCRVIYAQQVEKVEFLPYQTRRFQRFKIVTDDTICYDFKYLNREILNQLVQKKGDCDDILIIKQGWVTDTSIANVAFWDQRQWLTPTTPLLKGTTRERLLREKQLIEAPIRVEMLGQFSQMALMNAMLGFYILPDFSID